MVELDEDDPRLQDKCRHVKELMMRGLKAVCPDVRVGADGALMRRWYKEASPLYDDAGNLLIWTPELAAKMKLAKKEEKIDMDADTLEENIGGISND